MKKFIASLLVAASACLTALTPAHAAGGAAVQLDKFPTEKLHDTAALQRGAQLFVNYCLNCHAAAFMRFNRLQDIGLTEQQIKDNLLFTTDKVGDLMNVSLNARQAKEWLGATPPDLTVIARSRASHAGSGADYLYTYLRTYYR
ncbi:MAG: cytochrome c1, partial [Ottowia sp.]|nr:cytochrome c1 [Ottowia sp.]